MSKKTVLVMFGGVSPEHEVSIITGLQVLENIDKEQYDPIAVFVSKQGEYMIVPNLISRKDFLNASMKTISFGVDKHGGYIQTAGLTGKKYYPYAVYLAFHGGFGESGQVQGMLEALGLPFTSANQESSVIAMNKNLTKLIVENAGINVVPGVSLLSRDIKLDLGASSARVLTELNLPVIIKPVHLGSSIGIKVAHDEIELQKFLLEAANIDSEILIEKLLTDFTEYNCSVRLIEGKLQTSEIEKPLSRDEILSFADKYERGAKKTGGNGMASLQRELPAKISTELKQKIEQSAKRAFEACHCKGMVRIDFMVTQAGDLFMTEINPIPGSMSFYLWESGGVPFKQQITDLVEQSVVDNSISRSTRLDYQTDIVQKFVNS